MSGMAPFLPDSGRPGRWPLSIVGSVVLHVGVAAGLLALAQTATPPDTPEAAEPRFAITLETLTPATLAGVMTVEPNPEIEPSIEPPDALPPVEGPDLATPVEPDSPDLPDPEDPEDPEFVPASEAQVAIPVAPVTPEISAPISPAVTAATNAITPSITQPVSPVSSAVAAGTPEIAAPVGPVAPVSPLAGPGLTRGGGGSGTVTAAIDAGTIVTGPVAPQTQVAGAIAGPSIARPTPSGGGGGTGVDPPPAPSVQDIAVSALLTRVAGTPGPACTLALPRRAGSDAASLALIGTDGSALDTLARAILTGDLSETAQTRALIDGRQCPVLDWVAATRDYPATRLGLRLDARIVDSGTTLSGIVQGVGGRFLTLLLIDDNGVVQDLARFTTISGNLARFDAPVTRDGASRDTRQVVLALATRTAPTALRGRMGQVAQDVFTGLPDDLSQALLGFETVDIR